MKSQGTAPLLALVTAGPIGIFGRSNKIEAFALDTGPEFERAPPALRIIEDWREIPVQATEQGEYVEDGVVPYEEYGVYDETYENPCMAHTPHIDAYNDGFSLDPNGFHSFQGESYLRHEDRANSLASVGIPRLESLVLRKDSKAAFSDGSSKKGRTKRGLLDPSAIKAAAKLHRQRVALGMLSTSRGNSLSDDAISVKDFPREAEDVPKIIPSKPAAPIEAPWPCWKYVLAISTVLFGMSIIMLVCLLLLGRSDSTCGSDALASNSTSHGCS